MREDIKIEVKDNIGEKAQIKIIEIEGVIDTSTASELDKVILVMIEKINKPGVSLIFDFSKLTYINSTGLTRVMSYYMEMKRRSGVLKITNVSKNIYEILKIVGATKLIQIYNNLDEAIGGQETK